MPSTDCYIIHKDCPKCGCDKKLIEYWNCGPIVYIKCPDCGFVLKDGIDAFGDGLFDLWNKEED